MLDHLAFIRLLDVVDILIVAFVLYKVITWIRGTRAMQLVKGLAVFLVAAFISRQLGLVVTNTLLDAGLTMGLVAIPVIFQPELRRALEQLGRGRLFLRPGAYLGQEELERLVSELVRAVQVLSRGRVGALLVLERQTGLKDVVETGIRVDGVVSAEFLVNVFVPNTPLHDGATVIRDDRVVAAGCFLPLSENPDLCQELGTRHRAALGISEQSDALAIAVSEETGTISVAEEGRLRRHLNAETLEEILMDFYRQQTPPWGGLFQWRSENG